MSAILDRFQRIYFYDFEFDQSIEWKPRPLCLVALELRSGELIRLWGKDLKRSVPPYPLGPDCLFVSFTASAEHGCHLALGWPLPGNVLDLFIEFKVLTNGALPKGSAGLLDALQYFGLPSLDFLAKKRMRDRVLQGGPYTSGERQAILDYCQSDVDSLAALWPKMLPKIENHLEYALHRAQFMATVAAIERRGIPIDRPLYQRLLAHWDAIRTLIAADCPVYRGLHWSYELFEQWLADNGLAGAWPRLATGKPSLDKDDFKDMAALHPAVEPIRAARITLSQLKLSALAIGADGRNRAQVKAFATNTARNAPSSTQSIFGPAKWLRSLVKPPPGWGLAYIDYEQEEVGIAAALSEDANLIEGYQSGDIYLAFAIQAGLVPRGATRASQPAVRNRCKTFILASQYGGGAATLARRLGCSEHEAQDLLDAHRRTYARYWEWSDGAADSLQIDGFIETVFGWPLHFSPNFNPRSVRNFPMQANGAGILHLACNLAHARSVRICWPVHDALLIEAPLAELDCAVAVCQQAMIEAGRFALGGFELRLETQAVRYPNRFIDEKGGEMWAKVMRLLAQAAGGATAEVGEKSALA